MSSAGGFNAFARPVDGIRSKSTSGGVITVLAYTTATILFLSQLFLYIQVDTRHSLDLAQSFPLSEVIPTEGGFSKKILEARGSKNKKRKSKSVYDALKFIETNKIDVFVHVTFPFVRCDELDFAHNGHYFSTGDFSKYHGYAKLSKRHPTEYDWAISMGMSTKGLSKKKRETDPKSKTACTVRGTLSIPRISGDITISLSATTFTELVKYLNMGMDMDAIDNKLGGHDLGHYIHEISFGKIFPLAVNPLSNKKVVFDNEFKIALNAINAKLVSTNYKRFASKARETFQISTSNHIVSMNTLAATNPFSLPGLKIVYDFTPLAVNHVESRENFFVFLSSLIGIVGGVFVTVSLVSGIAVNSVQALKKID